MKKIILLIVLIILNSCVVPYDAETRLLFETQLVDSNENVLSDIDIEINVSNGSGLGSGNETISYGKTNSNGEIKLIFPSPEFDKGYKIFIRSKQNENLGFIPFEIDNLTLENFLDYKLSVPKIYRLTYDESVPVYLQFNPINGNRTFLDLKIEGIFCPTFSDYNDEEETFFTNYIYAKKNQTIVINYKIENVSTGVIETISQEINIGTEAIETIINY
jgi:hypothetical protein